MKTVQHAVLSGGTPSPFLSGRLLSPRLLPGGGGGGWRTEAGKIPLQRVKKHSRGYVLGMSVSWGGSVLGHGPHRAPLPGRLVHLPNLSKSLPSELCHLLCTEL